RNYRLGLIKLVCCALAGGLINFSVRGTRRYRQAKLREIDDGPPYVSVAFSFAGASRLPMKVSAPQTTAQLVVSATRERFAYGQAFHVPPHGDRRHRSICRRRLRS